jgi:sodium/hydrogen antiporter
MNDGLALPFVLVFLAMGTRSDVHPADVALELVLGLLLGVGLPLLTWLALRLPVLGAEPRLQPLGPLALAIVLCQLTHANAYLAAFAAGVTLATVAPRASHAFEGFGELVSELTKFAAVLVFGALLTPAFFLDLTVGEWAVALLALLVVRPASVLASLWRAGLPRRELYAAAWFGPKGFASVVYGLLAAQSGIPAAQTVFELVALTIAVSIVAHSMSDVPVARAFDVEPLAGLPEGPEPAPAPETPAGEVHDDVVDAVVGDAVRVGAGGLDGVRVARPAGCLRRVAGLPRPAARRARPAARREHRAAQRRGGRPAHGRAVADRR